jgi:hypothetical protein
MILSLLRKRNSLGWKMMQRWLGQRASWMLSLLLTIAMAMAMAMLGRMKTKGSGPMTGPL